MVNIELTTLRPGESVQGSKYVIEKILGQGGFGITYLATQIGLDRKVALKEFYMSSICLRNQTDSRVSLSSQESKDLWESFKTKFIKEARTIASLSHPNIINIIDVFEDNGTAYYAMEYLPNGSLKDKVRSFGTMSEKEAINLIAQVGEALDYIHGHHILHLDIKPDNIMLRNGETPVIIDFGISKRYDETGNQTSMMQGAHSRGYAPVEQYKYGGLNEFTPATDVYSLSATLYFILMGIRPPEPTEIYENGLKPIPNISIETWRSILKGMSMRRVDRPQTAKEFISMLPLSIIQDQSNAEDIKIQRDLIESLIRKEAYKEAYNICLDNIRRGIDIKYSKELSLQLAEKLRSDNKSSSRKSLVLAIIGSIVATIIIICLQS